MYWIRGGFCAEETLFALLLAGPSKNTAKEGLGPRGDAVVSEATDDDYDALLNVMPPLANAREQMEACEKQTENEF